MLGWAICSVWSWGIIMAINTRLREENWFPQNSLDFKFYHLERDSTQQCHKNARILYQYFSMDFPNFNIYRKLSATNLHHLMSEGF